MKKTILIDVINNLKCIAAIELNKVSDFFFTNNAMFFCEQSINNVVNSIRLAHNSIS